MAIFNRIRTEDWNFTEDPQFLVLCSRQILEDGLPVLLVTHDEVGNWRFLNGGEASMADVRFVTLDSVLGLDLSLEQLAALPVNRTASRATPDGEWTIA